MDQPSMFDEQDDTLARMTINLAWNNGPFTDGRLRIVCWVGSKEVFQHHQTTSDQEQDFSEVLHIAAREASRLVLGHRVTNSHIRRGRVIYGALNERSFELDEKEDAK